MITRTALAWWQRKSWHGERPRDDVPESAGGEHAEDIAARQWVWQEVLRLPPRQRAAVVLRYYEDLTIEQTAEVLGCTAGTVKSQVSAALKRLRERLGTDVLALTGSDLKVGMTE